MPQLKNPRHERFAQELADGKTLTEAYRVSGLERRVCSHPEGFYVYMLCDPRTHLVFYVGKGKRGRWRQHERDCRRGVVVNQAKYERIQEILGCGKRPIALLLEDGLSERAAFAIENRMIALIGPRVLTNYCAGNPYIQVMRKTKDLLRRIMPFKAWAARRSRTQEEIDLYWFVVRGLLKNNANLEELSYARP